VEEIKGRGKRKDSNIRAVLHLRFCFYYEVENASSSHFSMVDRVAQKIPSIHYDLYVTIYIICHLFWPKSQPHLKFVSTILHSVTCQIDKQFVLNIFPYSLFTNWLKTESAELIRCLPVVTYCIKLHVLCGMGCLILPAYTEKPTVGPPQEVPIGLGKRQGCLKNETRQAKTKQSKTRKDKTRQDKTRKDKTRQTRARNSKRS
jgi:hypothetical protein